MIFRRDLLKNKLFALLFILLGFLSIPACDMDATFFVFALMMGSCMFFSRTDVFDESQYYEEDEDEPSTAESCRKAVQAETEASSYL